MPPEYSSYCNENNTPILLTTIPNVLEGFAFLLVFMTMLEFICAQALLRLKGLLIVIWYALLAVDCWDFRNISNRYHYMGGIYEVMLFEIFLLLVVLSVQKGFILCARRGGE